jgi:pimeloyl-ACP methyl ester carboxylesterase
MAPSTSLGTPPQLAIACSDAPAAVYDLPANLPAMDNSHRGDVFHCAPGESLTTAFANQQATDFGYTGAALPTGFWTYRIAYRSLRNTPATGTPAEGDMVAVLALPEKPLAGAPLVVVGHPTMGLGTSCGPSHTNLADPKQKNDYSAAVIPLAAYGYTVLIPDYAGFSYGQVPGYFNAEDEAHALLDATRAATRVLPSSRAFSKVVLVGHSQGGHAVIAAETMANSYGLDGELVGVAAWAPFWTSMSAWGALLTPLAGYTTSKNGEAILFSMFYFYSAGELRDGPGMGVSMFQPAKQAGAKAAVLSNSCLNTSVEALGNVPTDFFDDTFVQQVGVQCATGPDCTQGAAPTWLARWKEDRPHLDPMGPPMLIWYAGMDTFVAPGYAECAIERFAADLSGAAGATASVQVCFDGNATHQSLPRTHVEYVNHWIAARAGVETRIAAPCPPFPTGMTCVTPPNDF